MCIRDRGRLHDRLVVDGDVVDDVPPTGVLGLAVHPAQPVLHDVGDLVAVGGVIRDDRRVRRREQRRVPVGVLQSLDGQRRATRRRPDEEATRHLVAGRPDRVTRPLEPEHRVEDIDRDHRLPMRGVCRARCGERRKRTGFVDAQVQDLPLLCLLYTSRCV